MAKEQNQIHYAKAKYIRKSPFKIRRVADVIRRKSVVEAEALLKAINNGATDILSKLLNSAKHNCIHNFDLDPNKLVIEDIQVNEGPRMKRFQPRAKGRIYQIIKRSSHVSLGLTEK